MCHKFICLKCRKATWVSGARAAARRLQVASSSTARASSCLAVLSCRGVNRPCFVVFQVGCGKHIEYALQASAGSYADRPGSHVWILVFVGPTVCAPSPRRSRLGSTCIERPLCSLACQTPCASRPVVSRSCSPPPLTLDAGRARGEALPLQGLDAGAA